MRELHELEIKDYGYGFPTERPTDSDISQFESEIGCKLPQQYLALLCFRNGGNPGHSLIVPKYPQPDDFLVFEVYFCLNNDRESLNGLWKNYFVLREILPKNSFPFGSDQSGDYFFLTCLNDNCSVWHGTGDRGFLPETLVADTFEEFIDQLRPYRDLPAICSLYEPGPDGNPRFRQDYLVSNSGSIEEDD